MKRQLKASIVVVILSVTTADVIVAQSRGVTPGLPRRMESSIDPGFTKRAPSIGDEKIARKSLEHIDDGIFYPRRIVRHYNLPVTSAFKQR